MLDTVAHKRAIDYSRGGQLPFELFDAIAYSEDEAADLQMDVNAKILVAETLASIG